MRIGSDTFDVEREQIDVTSCHRADPTWQFVDAQGHHHQWYVAGQPATSYRPEERYDTPTLIWVKDGEEYWDDSDEPHPIGHLECRQCGEHVSPGYTADTTRQFIPGLARYRINDEDVSPDEFQRRYEAAGRLTDT